jgi:SAM-dependent methyltransferase
MCVATVGSMGASGRLASLADVVEHAREWLFFRREYVPDRHVLEDVIFPSLLERADVRRVLFVGCAWYTRRYPGVFEDREFWTLDVDPRQARHGAARHVVDSVTNMSAHFEPASLDAVICSGVIGFGLDAPEEADAAIRACFECLRPGGTFILGVDDCAPFPLDALPSLTRFEPVVVPPFPAATYPTFSGINHTFCFYARPGDARRS